MLEKILARPLYEIPEELLPTCMRFAAPKIGLFSPLGNNENVAHKTTKLAAGNVKGVLLAYERQLVRQVSSRFTNFQLWKKPVPYHLLR